MGIAVAIATARKVERRDWGASTWRWGDCWTEGVGRGRQGQAAKGECEQVQSEQSPDLSLRMCRTRETEARLMAHSTVRPTANQTPWRVSDP